MKPYLAVIADSFHSALSSRILWVAFVAIWLLLIALAPIGYHEDYTTEFRWFDLENGTQMKAMLARGLVDPKEADSALARLANTFPDEIKRKLRQVAEGDDIRIDKGALSNSLNKSLDEEDWYDEVAWQKTVRLKELRELDEIASDTITEPERRRRARLRIEAALPGVFAAKSARTITLSYAGFDFPAIFAIGKPQFVALINQFVVPALMDWLLGFALIFLGILVTASIVPEMLEPGSLHLLLSKPISRTLLLLSKFVGGCAFVFLCVCQIVVGLWLIAGFRLDIWNARILWCIPVAVFLFAVFYSVSTLAGLRWRSPILSIGVTCMFGAFVFVIGAIGGYFDGFVKRPDEIRHLRSNGDDAVISTRGGGLKFFDKTDREWKIILENDFRGRDLIVPPVQLEDGIFATARIRNGRFNLYGSGSLDLLVLDRQDDFEARPSIRLPIGTRRLFVEGDSLVALNNSGLMVTSVKTALSEVSKAQKKTDEGADDGADQTVNQDDESPSDESPSDESSAEAATTKDASKIGVTAWISDLLRMQGGATDGFRPVLPAGVALSEPLRVGSVPGQRSFAIYTRGRLLRVDLPTDSPPGISGAADAGVGSIIAETTIDGDDSTKLVMGVGEKTIVVARAEEPVRFYNTETLDQVAEFEPVDQQEIRSIVPIEGSDRFACLTIGGDCYLLNRDGSMVSLTMLPISEATAIAYDMSTERLAIGHHIDRVDFFDIQETPKRDGRIQPSLSNWRSVDQWVINPLRTLTPQTGELSATIASLVSGKSAFAIGDGQNEEQQVIRLRVARPLLSCGAFMIVMLSISCFYFVRRDF